MPSLDQVKYAITDQPVAETILRRWSPRAFSDRPVAPADLKILFTAASWAASSYNEQPWRFLLGVNPGETYMKLFSALLPLNQGWAKDAPVLYASLAKKTFTKSGQPNKVALHDVGAASATLSLEATRLGLHTHGMAGFDADLLRASFGIPTEFDPVAVWALGYLGDPANLPDNFKVPESQPRDRKPLADILFEDWEKPATL